MIANKFRGKYSIQDGYVGKDRPQYFEISEGEIEDDMTEADLRTLYQDAVDDAFQRDISPFGDNEDEFVRWAMSTIEASKC